MRKIIETLALVSCVALFAACGGHALSSLGSQSSTNGRVHPNFQFSHVLTWQPVDNGQANNFTPPPSGWSAVAPYVDYIAVGQSQMAANDSSTIAAQAPSILLVEYTNPNRQVAVKPPPNPEYNPVSVATDCTGHQVRHGSFYQMDPSNSTLQNAWLTEVTNFVSPTQPPGWTFAYGGSRTYVFEDVANNLSGDSPLPCPETGKTVQQTWTDYTDRMDKFLHNTHGLKLIFNGLDPAVDNPPTGSLLNSAYYDGGMAEGCYARNTNGNPVAVVGANWSELENLEISFGSGGKKFICHSNSQGPDNPSDLRMYTVASYLLTFDLFNSVLVEQFSAPNGMTVFPESQIVPTQPVITSVTNISTLAINGTPAYGREYSACHIVQTAIGGCEVVVNPGTTPATIFWPTKYTEHIALSGDDVLSSPNGATVVASPPSGSVPAGTAVIAVAP